jgi:hypothetical protein
MGKKGPDMVVRRKLIRWTLLLCAGLFSSMLILGQDRGQQRLGLSVDHTSLATRNIVAPALAEPPPVTKVSISFTPPEPLIAVPVRAEDKPAEQAASASVSKPVLRYVRSNRANLRAGPGKEFPVRAKLARGQSVELAPTANDENGWTFVKSDGARGYISSDLLSDQAP